MESQKVGDITQLLRDAHAGTAGATDRLIARVYDDLRAIAHNRIRDSQTLDPTVIVHEAYLRLFGREGQAWENRYHFFFAAARVMRSIVVDEARRAKAAKRGGPRVRIELTDQLDPSAAEPDIDFIALDDALEKLQGIHPLAAKVVMLRFFAGLTREEIAAELELSPGAVWREWNFAKAWLLDEMEGPRH